MNTFVSLNPTTFRENKIQFYNFVCLDRYGKEAVEMSKQM